jgi:hypothetical protein
MRPEQRERIADMFKELERPYKTLTAWELNFLDSVRGRFEITLDLSERQVEVLEKIFLEKTLQ